jgi:hypothetical protein
LKPARGALAAVVATGALFSLGAGATASAAARGNCTRYKGGAAGLTDTFTDIDARGVSCHKADEVLGTWANSGPGGTDLGFSCHARKGAKKDQFHLRCSDATKLITALDTETTARRAHVSAVPVSPKPGTSYHGTGKDYMNNAPKWADEGSGKISFTTSADGKAVMHFSGSYSYYCGAGTSTVTEKRMAVSASGHFGTEFSQKLKGASAGGTAYASIAGQFTDGGEKASVSYLIDYVFKGDKVKHPYSTKNPKALGCATWVRGTVKAK